jgi:hypothetical protein
LSEEVNQFVQKQQMSDALKAVSERVLPAYEDLQRDARDFLTNQRDRMNSEALDVSASASSTRVLAFVSVGLDEVATAMRQVTESAVQVQRLSNEVNAGSEEQARAIEQNSKAILSRSSRLLSRPPRVPKRAPSRVQSTVHRMRGMLGMHEDEYDMQNAGRPKRHGGRISENRKQKYRYRIYVFYGIRGQSCSGSGRRSEGFEVRSPEGRDILPSPPPNAGSSRRLQRAART